MVNYFWGSVVKVFILVFFFENDFMCDVFYVMKEIIKWKEKELNVMFVFWKKFIYVVYLKEYF